jgi:hypothetical protein
LKFAGISKDQVEAPKSYFLKRREVKALAKKYLIKELYLDEGLKPRVISKRLKVPVEMVYSTIAKVKNEMKRKA